MIVLTKPRPDMALIFSAVGKATAPTGISRRSCLVILCECSRYAAVL